MNKKRLEEPASLSEREYQSKNSAIFSSIPYFMFFLYIKKQEKNDTLLLFPRNIRS